MADKKSVIKESWLSIIGKMPQNTARLKFLAYGGLYSVEGSEDPTQFFVKGYIFSSGVKCFITWLWQVLFGEYKILVT